MSLEAIIDEVINPSEVPFGAGKEAGEQGSIEWLMSRVGHCTGSRFKDVVAKQKNGKPSASRETYLLELVTERLLNKPGDYYFSNAMQWGIDNEAAARQAYEAKTGNLVIVPEFVKHPDIEWCGVSADGLIDEDGTIEIKCPANPKNTVVTWLDGMPSEHMAQVQGGLWVLNRQWSDFITYDPRMPNTCYVQRIERDEKYIEMLESEVREFLGEVAETLQRIQEKMA